MNARSLLDRLQSGTPSLISEHCYRLVSTLCTMTPEKQLQALSLMFHLASEHYGIDKRQLLEIGENVLKDADRNNNEHIRALRMYVENEL